jgi:hypothetical protein
MVGSLKTSFDLQIVTVLADVIMANVLSVEIDSNLSSISSVNVFIEQEVCKQLQ